MKRNTISDEELKAEMLKEWISIDDFRLSCCRDLLDICRTIHSLREKLTEGMIEVLVEDKWR